MIGVCCRAAVDLVSIQKMENHLGIHESAAAAEMKTIEQQLFRILQSHHQQIQLDFSKKAVNRTGHARFRRRPSDPSTSSQSEPFTPIQLKPIPKPCDSKISEECKTKNTPISSGSSSITGEEGTVSNGKRGLLNTAAAPAPRVYSSRKPPLPSSHRKRCRDLEPTDGISGKRSISRGCHCCKRRKTVEIRRVTTTKGGSSSIPADEYSWRKYYQKLIPGTLFPRGYYKCSSVKGCPARKHAVRSQDDPTVLVVTYEGEHRHNRWILPGRLNRSGSVVGILVESK